MYKVPQSIVPFHFLNDLAHSPICQDLQPVPLRYVGSEACGRDVMLLVRCQPFPNVVLLSSVWQKRKINVFFEICYYWSPLVVLRCPEQFLTSLKTIWIIIKLAFTPNSPSLDMQGASPPNGNGELTLMPWFSGHGRLFKELSHCRLAPWCPVWYRRIENVLGNLLGKIEPTKLVSEKRWKKDRQGQNKIKQA